MSRILIIDDEKEIVMLMKKSLEDAGYEVSYAYNGHDGLELLSSENISLVVLDIMMPGMNGIDVCRTIRIDNNVPIIIVSAKSQNEDKIEGLVSGSDDYMIKPFCMDELIARVSSQLRRAGYLNSNLAGAGNDEDLIRIKGLLINKRDHTVSVYGAAVKLTKTEYEILLLLAENPGRVFSSEKMYQHIWKDKYFEGNNTIMAHMWRLREKIEQNPKNPQIIETIWGVGYKIEED